MPPISLITAVYNRGSTIESAITSAAGQSDCDVEHIVIDGMSTDQTETIVAKHAHQISQSIREPDNGIYDALNKGIIAATGNIVGFLHADDLLADESVLSSVADKFASGNFDAIYGDLLYVDSVDTDRVIRYWKSGKYDVRKFKRGWMPPHPTVYVRREVYEQLGMYRTDHGSAADYECMIRLMVAGRIRVGYLPKVMVKMRVGGKSNASIQNRLAANQADQQAWALNGLTPPWGLRFSKPLRKLPQYWRKPK